MRGEDDPEKFELVSDTGSPPHARGRRLLLVLFVHKGRITPACAGKTVRLPRESDKVVFQLTSFPSLPT